MKWSFSLLLAVALLTITLISAKSLNPNESGSSKVQSVQESLQKNKESPKRLNLDFGQMRESADQSLPEPVMISSQPITVNTRKTAGSIGIKRGRSIPSASDAGARVIEGVRVPDNEEDKFHTWRNARVIKGHLVPKDRKAQPHKKRQIMVQDATQYLASHGLSVPQFQQLYQQQQQQLQQQQQSVIDASAFQAVAQAAAASQQQNVFFTPQPMVQQQQQQFVQDVNTGAIYATASPVTAKQFHITPVPIQASTAVPVVFQPDGQLYSPGSKVPINAKFHARTGVEIQGANIIQSQLKNVAKPQVSIYSPSSPKQPEVASAPVPSSIEVTQTPQNNQNSENPSSSSVVLQQGASTLIQTQQPATQQHQHPVQQLIQVQQQQQQQSQPQQVAQLIQVQPQAQNGQQPHQQLAAQILQVHQQQQQQLQQQHQNQLVQQQQVQQQQLQQAQQQLSQVIQLQPHQQQQSEQIHTAQLFQQFPGQTAYILNSPGISPNQIEDRNSPAYQHTANTRYIIKPQTYVAGPGGQVFTVPVPIPADQEVEESQQQPQQQHFQENRERQEHEEHGQGQPEKKHRPGNPIFHKVMDAFSMNRKTMERVETNVALPVLATAGVLFGLGALAAGWYLSSQNREVGYLRRTGKPHVNTGSGVNLKRVRRQVSEVDQAGFFQSIIQHAIEKQQKEYEDSSEPVSQPTTVAIPSIQRPRPPPKAIQKPAVSRLDETEFAEKGSHGHHHSPPKKKHGHWLASRQAINFAKVAIPAVVLGGAVLAIGALIFGWYITGSNREIAFLEPSAYSRRRKRDLTTTQLSDSWVQRLLTAIHSNPYGAAGTSSNSLTSITFDPDTSKGNSFEATLSHAVVAVALASVAFLTMLALLLAWLFAENGRTNDWLENGGVGFGGWPNHYRKARSVTTNSIGEPELGSTLSPGFLASILTDLEVSHSRILKKLQETAYSQWQETPCAKRIFCDVMSTQSDDTIRAMEKRMVTFVSMLPDSLSSSLSRTLGDVMNSIHRRDCSSFACKGHWVDPSIVEQLSPSANEPR